jgi:hypothetical protein
VSTRFKRAGGEPNAARDEAGSADVLRVVPIELDERDVSAN